MDSKLTLYQTDSGKDVEQALEGLFQRIRNLELGSGDDREIAENCVGLWDQFRIMADLSFLGRGAIIFALAETEIEETDIETGEKGKLWQITQIATDQAGVPLPPSGSWVEFCFTHLGKSPSEVSNLKNNFKVYYQDLKLPVVDILLAGDSRLDAARAYLAENPTDALVKQAVFGNKRVCNICGEDNDPNAMICVGCNEPFVALKPMPVEEVRQVVKEQRAVTTSVVREVWVLDGHMEQQNEFIRINVELLERESGNSYSLPVWEIDTVDFPEEVTDTLKKLLGLMLK